KWIIYTNHIGDKQIFYYKMRDRVIFGSEINYLVSYMKNNKISYTFDEIGAYFILTYSYMLEDYTLFKEIKKLNAGKYIKIDNNKFEVKTYYEIDNTPNHDQTEDEIIENIDRLFRNAIELEFEKDKEYNYKHVVTLSGGLDSRMTSWVAHDMGYKDQLNVTFSQTDYLDEKIAKEIARDLKHEWLFQALDNGLYLMNLNEIIKINFGNCLYSGNAHVNYFIKTFNFNSYGLYHTGQVGGIVKGYIYQNRNNNLEYRGAFSKLLFNKIDFKNINTYKNEGIFKLKNIPFNGTLQGNLPVQNYTEVISPFLDPDLIDYALQIPDGYKENELFIKWILKKYPGAAKYKWEAINGKITDKTITIMGRTTTLKALPRKVINKIFHKSAWYHMNTKKHMNPFDYWYRTNENLKNFIDSTFKENISLLENNELKKDCQKLFTEGNTFEKTQVLTLLAAYKYYFGENNAET
ncbi:MAG: asparagine synthase, partial [Defluviitoga tunisiensis]